MPRAAPFKRWHDVAELVRLASVSSMVSNIEAPINVILVGPPGDGKTAMVLRAERLPNVQTLSDATYLGLCAYLRDARDGLSSCLVIPDLGTLAARRGDTAKQAVATLAMMCAEGVRTLRVGKSVKDFGGARSSVVTAITPDDLLLASDILSQNAFLSRVFILDFDLTWGEQEQMLDRKWIRKNRSLLTPFRFPKIRRNKHGLWDPAPVTLSRAVARRAMRWWTRLRRERNDRWFAFRTGDALVGLLQASAYMHGRRAVVTEDVQYIEARILPLLAQQIHLERITHGQ